jgi:hypothetical protein
MERKGIMNIEWRETVTNEEWSCYIGGVLRGIVERDATDPRYFGAQTVVPLPHDDWMTAHSVRFQYDDFDAVKATIEALVALEHWHSEHTAFDVTLPINVQRWLFWSLLKTMESDDEDEAEEAYTEAKELGQWLLTRWRGKAQ